MRPLLPPLVGLLLIPLAACREENQEPPAMAELLDQPLQGVIAGAPWEGRLGVSDRMLDTSDTLFAHITDANLNCDAVPRGVGLAFRLPLRESEYTLGENRVVHVIHADATELEATEGILQVDSVTHDSIRGALQLYIDDDNYVEGEFTVVDCS